MVEEILHGEQLGLRHHDLVAGSDQGVDKSQHTQRDDAEGDPWYPPDRRLVVAEGKQHGSAHHTPDGAGDRVDIRNRGPLELACIGDGDILRRHTLGRSRQ